ncbi:transcription factor bHLH68-like isoform X2 [Phragmites australis]|uniref:transcription factor bHLH68-like isoform X2 n=1 Tax=Phragmites australis TaxID=29695 RepID=UPI002D764B99|nr:transcription factor bHLH68-like isoform X2 [Phragmites australis]
MDTGVVHKSSPLVGEMGEAPGHGWWSVNNLRPPFEQQHHPSLFVPSSTTTAPSSSALHSFSSLLLSNHYPLPTTSTSPWCHDSTTTTRQGFGQQDSWSQLILGGLANGHERYKEGQLLFPTASVCSEACASGSYIYSTTASHGNSTSDEIQLPWGSVHQHHKALQQKASSPRSSSITSTTSLGSNMLEFNNNSSPRECISRASGSAFKKARTQEPSPAQSTVKVRKEKLGDRITALHQLVSPFGKTDTASVLLEAIGYIRFLHGQIEVLGERHSMFSEDPAQLLHDNAMKKRGQPDQDGSCDEAKKDLRSRGLCLVPVSCTLHVGVDVFAGPADYWAAEPAFVMGFGR